MRIFRNGRPVIGMVHLLPLAGSPRARALHEVRAAALADARALARGGVDGLLVENYGDAPFSAGPVEPHVVALLAVLAREVRQASGLPTGVNVLRNDARAALAVAVASGASFIRVNIHTGAADTDQGRIEGRASETLRYRRFLETPVSIFADVGVKHARPLGDEELARAARETAYRGLADALLVTGPETGAPPAADRLRRIKAAVPDRPVLVASGLSPENIGAFPSADGYIVGSAFEKGGVAGRRVEIRRVRLLLRALGRRY